MARSVCTARPNEISKEEEASDLLPMSGPITWCTWEESVDGPVLSFGENSDSSDNQNNAMQSFENSGQANYRNVVTGR